VDGDSLRFCRLRTWASTADFSGDVGGPDWTGAFGVGDGAAGDTFGAEVIGASDLFSTRADKGLATFFPNARNYRRFSEQSG